jgi:hypothetical protein
MRDWSRTGWTHVLALGAAITVAACAADDPTAPGGIYVVMTRPPTVPAHYVPTPNGWFDPACVHRLDEQDRVLADGRIARLDGSVRAASACTSPRYDVEGHVVEGSRAGVAALTGKPATSGWIEYADSVALGPVSYFHAQWTVPPAPAVTDATIYFFPGLENRSSLNTPILQPVLGWNQYGGPAGWSLMSWDCCTQGTYYSAPIAAVAGASVSGDLTGSSCNASGVCASWQIVSHNLSTGKSTTLTATPGLAMDFVFSGVLETYGVSQCTQLPGHGVTFSGFAIAAASGTPLGIPTWSTHAFSASPSCGYGATSTGSSVTMAVAGTECTPNDDQQCCPFAGGCSCDGDQVCKANGHWGLCQGATPKGTACH